MFLVTAQLVSPLGSRAIGIWANAFGDPYSLRIMQAAAQKLTAEGFHAICLTGGFPDAPFFRAGSARSCFGALILLSATMRGFRPAALRAAADFGELMISIGEELPGVSSVIANGETGVFQAVAHLIKCHERRQIAFIAAPEGSADGAQRLSAYRGALEYFGLPYDPSRIIQGDYEALSGREAVRQMRSGVGRAVDAIVAANDLMAIGAVEELRAQGLEVPRDVAVIGFDDLEEAAFTSPTLTTVRQPVHEQGFSAVELLIQRLRGERREVETIVVPTPLVVRRSCGCRSEDGGGERRRPAGADVSLQELLEDALRRLIRRELAARRLERELSSVAEAILGASGFAELAPVMSGVSELLRFKRFLLCVYDRDGRHTRVLLESRGREVVPRSPPEAFAVEQLLPPGFLKPGEPTQAYVEPLSLMGEHFGYMVVEGDSSHAQARFELRQYLSGALGRIALKAAR